jgi:hypothetical protein
VTRLQQRVYNGGKWEAQPGVTVVDISAAELAACRAELASEEAASRLANATHGVRIAMVAGYHAARVNGMYEATSERSADGTVTIYRKVGDVYRLLLEYYAPNKQWQVKPQKYKGTALAWISCAVPAKCLPEECPVGQWQVDTSGQFEAQPAVTVAKY